jgi:hypothetical protein
MRLWPRTFGLALSVASFGFLGCDSGPSTVTNVVLTSPSGDVELSVTTDGEGKMTYTVRKDGVTMIESSPLGLASTTHDLTAGVTMSSSSVRTVRESYTMLVGKRRDREVEGSEITVPLKDANGARAELIMRAHEDGVAFRYHLLGEGTSEVTSESTGFAIPSGARPLLRPYDGGEIAYIFTAGALRAARRAVRAWGPVRRNGLCSSRAFRARGGESLCDDR